MSALSSQGSFFKKHESVRKNPKTNFWARKCSEETQKNIFEERNSQKSVLSQCDAFFDKCVRALKKQLVIIQHGGKMRVHSRTIFQKGTREARVFSPI